MSVDGIGKLVPRAEDPALLTGQGAFTDDLVFPGQAYMYVLRSPHAAARILSIDTTQAKLSPGVIAVYDGRDVAQDGMISIRSYIKRKLRDGRPNPEPPYPVLALDNVRYVGDMVAIVIAEKLDQAKDAAELVEVDYEPQPAVIQTEAAMTEGAPLVWPDVENNIVFVHEAGNRSAVEEAFARAAHVAKLDVKVSRVVSAPLENRNAIGLYDAREKRLTLYAGMQSPHTMRARIADCFNLPEAQVRVVGPDCGGSFGLKNTITPEIALVLWAARKLSRPVRWQAERSEAMMGDKHSRDMLSHVELALSSSGEFLALKVETTAALGAYLTSYGLHPPVGNLGTLAGTYRTPAIHVEVTGVFTNTSPTGSYRGAGRPEAASVIECVIDIAAREMRIDPAELRRRNMIPPESLPYRTPLGFTYDSGEFERNLNRALELADWSGFPQRRERALRKGLLRGIGIASVIEIAGGVVTVTSIEPSEEYVEMRFTPSGELTVLVGAHSQGQGHVTMFRQLVSEFLGLDAARVRIIAGDTDQVYYGLGAWGSRTAFVGGHAFTVAAKRVIDKARDIAAHLLEAAPNDITFNAGMLKVAGTDREISLEEVARASFLLGKLPPGFEIGLSASALVAPNAPTYPNGCHICEVEIDKETGLSKIVGYWLVDDVGTVINPAMVKGQLVGGVVQGLGQTMMEEILYDPESGQLLTGSFMDYAMPRAARMPAMTVESHEIPATTNPLGVKGVGEAGTVGALPAFMNAINDALYAAGAGRIDMPATSQKVWCALQNAASKT